MAASHPESAAGVPPSPWVAHFLAGVAPGSQVLDLACGGGRHVRLALQRGLTVTAVDQDTSRLGTLAGHHDAEVVTADLEDGSPFPLAGRKFGGVIVTNYLWRPILPAICAAVAPDGVLIYETFAIGHERLGGRPSHPDFLLRPNELADAAIAAGLAIIAFEQAREDQPRPRVVQRIAATGRDHQWVAAPPHRYAP
jgi:SAM-dependent methyltransferase